MIWTLNKPMPTCTKFICIEGLDGCGKHTTAQRLKERLTDIGYTVGLISQPIYDSPSGEVIRKYLRGDFGDPASLDPNFTSSLYTANRLEYFNNGEITIYGNVINTIHDRHHHTPYHYIIFDRSYYSNLIYHASKFRNIDKLVDWCIRNYRLEFNSKSMTKNPFAIDQVFYLTLSEEERNAQIKARGREVDMHESNQAYLRNCDDFVRFLYSDYGNDILREAFSRTTSPRELWVPMSHVYLNTLNVIQVEHGTTEDEISADVEHTVDAIISKIDFDYDVEEYERFVDSFNYIAKDWEKVDKSRGVTNDLGDRLNDRIHRHE